MYYMCIIYVLYICIILYVTYDILHITVTGVQGGKRGQTEGAHQEEGPCPSEANRRRFRQGERLFFLKKNSPIFLPYTRFSPYKRNPKP